MYRSIINYLKLHLHTNLYVASKYSKNVRDHTCIVYTILYDYIICMEKLRPWQRSDGFDRETAELKY